MEHLKCGLGGGCIARSDVREECYHKLFFSVQESWRGRVTRRGGLGSNEETGTSKCSNPGPNDLQQVSAKGFGHESIDYRLVMVSVHC